MSTVSRKVLNARYRLMPYLYSAFFQSHTYGCPLARPMFFGWPSDIATRSINTQWMMGDALLVSPILYQSTSTARAYFPAGTWYDFYTGRAIDSKNGTYDYVRVSIILSLMSRATAEPFPHIQVKALSQQVAHLTHCLLLSESPHCSTYSSILDLDVIAS